jgi:D-glucuronyl C5-epimerase C-terminus
MRTSRLSTIALALSALLAAPLATAQASARTPARKPAAAVTVTSALAGLKSGGAISEAQYTQYTGVYVAAERSLKKLSGTRHAELQSVIADTQQMAAAGEFVPTRLPVIFLTLEKNRQWWTTEPLIASRERVSFPPSKIVWEYYAGQGVQIQWLGTFGEANGYYLSGHENENLKQLLSEVLPLATDRAGGIAWEYMFHFDGGAPPWTSGLSQGTALQVLARAYSRFKEQQYLTAAQQALGIFEQPPPQGVRVQTPAGAEYAEYTYAPSDMILNGFIQADIGLYEYASITKDPLGLKLFEEGDAQARAQTPRYNTGAWSMYDQYGESDLNYHELLTEFLQHLCEKTSKGLPIRQANAPIAGDEIYCTTAQAFMADLHTPPVISLLTTTLPTSSRGGVQVSLSKVSDVHITVKRGSSTVWSNGATVERGKPKILWVTPAQAGTYLVTVTATDLAGNFSTATGTITLSKPTAPTKPPTPRTPTKH